MASKQGSTGSSQGGKHAKEKKPSPKNVYSKKNYKSSPNISLAAKNSSGATSSHSNSKKSVATNAGVSPHFEELATASEKKKFQNDSNSTAFLKHQNYQPNSSRHQNPSQPTNFRPRNPNQPNLFRHQNPNQPTNFRPRNPSQPNSFRHANQPHDFRHRNPSLPNICREIRPNQSNDFRYRNPGQPDMFRHRSPSHSNNFRFPSPQYMGQNQQQNVMPSQSNNSSFIQRSSQDRFSRPLENVPKQTHFQSNYRHHGAEQVKHYNNTSAQITNVQHKTRFQSTPSTNQLKSQNAANFRPYIGNSIITIKCKKKKSDSKSVNAKQKGKKNRNFKREERKKIKKQQSSQQKINDTDSSNAIPLFSFKKVSTEPEKNFDLIEFSDDDFEIVSQDPVSNSATEEFQLIDFSDVDYNTVSKQSVNTSAVPHGDLIDFSFDSTSMSVDSAIQSFSSSDDSDSSDDSEESAISSEISLNSSIVDTESSFRIIKPNMSTKEAFISVFWDIENCSLPSIKSAVDFVNYIRQTFYEGRSEDEFTAACDTSRLNNSIVKELEEASVILIHVSSLSKNAADKKLQSCLQRFQYRHRNSNSAVVLITSDSDFTQVLHDMRYQHHIYINLICSSGTKRSLIAEANKYVLFDDIVKNLPERCANDNMQYLLLTTNLPQMKPKNIKKCLTEKLKSFNCRIKVINNGSSAEITFQDNSVCKKAMNSLRGYYLGGNAINIIYQEKPSDDIHMEPKNKVGSLTNQSFSVNSSMLSFTKNIPSNSNMNKEQDSAKGATLCVFVSKSIGNMEYWKSSLETIFKTSEFSLQWDDSNFNGCLLIHFNSLKKAQKAKKVLQKYQLSDENAPKFMKIIKHDEDISLKMKVSSIEESNMKKINDHIQIIQKKTSKCLRNHQTVMDKIRLQVKTEVCGSSEVVSEKLIECCEQMDTFKNFSQKTIECIKRLSCNSENLGVELDELLSDFIHECNSISSALPIYAKKKLILQKCSENQVIIIRAETGSGKSTQLTQYIWKERNLFGNGQIICTQPRKIAAISLAKHVSSQVGCKLGDTVGFQVGMSDKKSVSTRILYVTDYTMLKILVNNDLENISFIIIDEAHERTIYTDILLGMIKQYLPRYPHLKIIITSATIDTSIFRDYFNLTDDTVLHIAGRTFPVEDVWLDRDVIPGWDYFAKTIDTAIDILSEELGDILCFLVNPLETEKAGESFSERLKGRGDAKKIKVYNLHGKLNAEEQQKVFEKTASGFRKVIFATNCAETSITIPGIKYVIDCGMVKESRYDPTRNINVLSTGFVSKSSSEQRRGRAGRTQIGKCYHLYSKNNYDQMADNTDPEILRINLGQALLKLMKMGIRDPIQFDFVQSPPKVLLNSAMKQLKYLKAVDENSLLLTDLGKKMAVLPLEPRLCHLIFQGFDKNIECEAITVAALLTVSSSIFFRNSENKDEADKKKRRFCESENDFLTYLEVYREWAGLPNRFKSQWCVTNCINARSMRIAHETINEIILTLQKELSYKVNLKFKSESHDTLIKSIFYSFSQNLSVFSGHFRFGYKSLNVSDRLLIHPSSSASVFGGSPPQFVIYETVMKTTQNYLMNVCPVTKDIILDGIITHGIKIDLTSLEDLIATEFCLSPLGEKMIINNFIGKKGMRRKDLLKNVRELTNSDLTEVDIDVTKGTVKIFGYGSQFDQVPSIVFPIVYAAQEKLLNEETDIYLLENTYPFIAILGAGGYFKDVILPGEFRDVKVILKGEADINSVVEKLQSYGPVKEIREWNKYYKVTFEISADAKKALESSNDQNGFILQSIHKCTSNNKNCLYKVDVSFLRRMCTGIAYVTLDQPVSSFLLPSSRIDYKGSVCNIAVSKKTNDLRITNLPADADRRDLEPLIKSHFPEFEIKKCIIVRKKPYDAAQAEIDSIKNNLIQLFSEFTFKENIEVNLKNPSTPKDWTWNATVYFKNPFDGETAVNVLKSRKNISNFLGGIVLKPILQTYLYSKPEIFSVVKDDIQEALQFFQNDIPADSSLDIAVVPKGSDKIEIKITSNSVSVITDARRSIYTVLIGDEIRFLNDSDNEKLFTDSGKEFIKKLARDFKDCFIFQNVFNKTITVFGKVNICNIIKMEINSFLKSLENEEFKDISLTTDSGKSILKELFKLFGFDLIKLKEEYKISDFQINKYKQILTIKGDLSAVDKCEAMIQNLRTQHESSFDETGEICPVCCDEVSDQKHRLEYCGHAYCKECLLHLFQSSESIPLNCEHGTEDNLCASPIVVADIIWVLKERESLKKVVYEKFLRSFVESRSDISYCPTPDCPMIFRVTEENMNIFKCPACNNDICTRCKELYQFTCSQDQCITSNTVDTLMNWFQEDTINRKRCPSCSAPIEKNGGCNHMTCWKCQCHMCWLCLEVFPSGDMVYAHQPYCPQKADLNN